MVVVKLVTEQKELEGIRELQEQNLGKHLSAEEASKEGFVTAEYTVDFLKAMHDVHPSIIAKDGNTVVGYALVATNPIREQHPLLADLFNSIDRVIYKGVPLKGTKYVVVGQLCVGKGYRGQGLVQRMYQFYRDSLKDSYDYLVTDVVQTNQRSIKAHLKTGFKVVDTLEYEGMRWDIVLWEF
jgi:ribosomal protein S18 acetylase RimI-like enzyme